MKILQYQRIFFLRLQDLRQRYLNIEDSGYKLTGFHVDGCSDFRRLGCVTLKMEAALSSETYVFDVEN